MTKELVENSLETALLSIINSTTNAVGKGIDFLSEQIPDVIHQLLLFKAVEQFVWFSVCAVSMSILFFVSRKFYKSALTKDTKYPALSGRFDRQGGCAVFLFMGCILIIPTVGNLIQFLKITLAPKIFLIEYAASLMGK